jgi:hypothetical protein
MNHVSCFALCLSSFVALAAVACSGAPDPIPTSSSKKASTAGEDTKTPSGTKTPAAGNNSSPSSPTTPAPSTPLSDTSACGKKADAQACGDCCLAGSPTALDAADKAEGDCMCATAACQTACAASVCSDTANMNEPTAACGTCLDAHQQECSAKFDAACTSAECTAAISCLTTQCDPLSAMTGGSSGSSGSSGGAFAARSAAFSARAMARSADQQ